MQDSTKHPPIQVNYGWMWKRQKVLLASYIYAEVLHRFLQHIKNEDAASLKTKQSHSHKRDLEPPCVLIDISIPK